MLPQVSGFTEDHPGGDDLILQYAGRDITTIMSDPIEHSHSDSAFHLLQEYQVGRVGAEESIVNEDFVWHDDFKAEDTDNLADWERNQFLDLDRPLVMQMFNSEFSKSFYLQQVHQPRYVRTGLLPARRADVPSAFPVTFAARPGYSVHHTSRHLPRRSGTSCRSFGSPSPRTLDTFPSLSSSQRAPTSVPHQGGQALYSSSAV